MKRIKPENLLLPITRISLRLPWLPVVCFLGLTIWFGLQLPNIRFETNLDRMASDSGDTIREVEQAAREFSIWEPLNLVLLGEMNQLSTIQKASEMSEMIRAIPNVVRVQTPFNADYIQLEGFSFKTLPVMTTLPESDDMLRLFRERLRLSPEGSRMISDADDAILFQLFIRGGVSARGKEAIARLLDTLDEYWGSGQYHLVGETFLGYMVDQSAIRDVSMLFPFSLLIVVCVLWLSFRRVWGVLLPGLTVIVSVVGTLGLMALNGDSMTIISAILPILLVTLGTADAIHVYNRYLEESRHTANKKTAILNTMKRLNIPVFMTSLTTALGFGSLMTSSINPVREFGYYSVFGIMCAMLFSLSAIPALLCWLPHPMFQKRRKTLQEGWVERGLLRFGEWIHRKKVWVVVLGTLLIGICVWGITRIEFESNLSRYFRKNTPVVQGVNAYEERFGGSSLLLVVVDTGVAGGTMDLSFIETLKEMESYIETYALLTNTRSFATFIEQIYPYTLTPVMMRMLNQQIGATGMPGYLSSDRSRKAAIQTYVLSAQTAEVSRTLARLERGLKRLLPDGMTLTFAGTPRVIQMHMENFADSQQKSLTLSGFTVFVVVSLLFASLFLGILAMMPLIFTVCINFGVMGLFQIPLDAATVLIASISIGVGIDYSIHFLERVLSELKGGVSLRTSCVHATKTTGHAIVINSVTLISGFGILVFSSFLTISAFGSLMAMTMGISALAALTIIPAFLGWHRLLPRRLKRWIDPIHESSTYPES